MSKSIAINKNIGDNFFDTLGEDNRHLLLVRAKELSELEAEQGGYIRMHAS